MWLNWLKKPKKSNIYSNCAELPVVIFYEILETGNIKLLIKSGFVKLAQLKKQWELIQQEFEQLTGNQKSHKSIVKSNFDLIRINRLNALITIYTLWQYRPKDNFADELKYWGVNVNSIDHLKTYILQEKTNLNIKLLKEQSKQTDTEQKTLESIIVEVENALNRNIEFEKISVKKWIELCKSVEEKANAIKKANNGRNNRK